MWKWTSNFHITKKVAKYLMQPFQDDRWIFTMAIWYLNCNSEPESNKSFPKPSKFTSLIIKYMAMIVNLITHTG